MPSVAIVLATLDRASVRTVLEQVCDQAPHDAEIVVVDQSGAEEHGRTRAWCEQRQDRRVRLQHRAERGLPAARNVGVALTEAPIVLFFDDDVRLHGGCIAAHLCRYRDPRLGGVVGRIVEQRLRPNAWRTTNRVGAGGRVITRLDGPDAVAIRTLKGANMSFRRSALIAAGGFDPGFAGSALLEDADASARVRRAGFTLEYEPDAAVDHLHEPTGGVRADGCPASWWRFHNTARFVRLHRGRRAIPALVATHGAIAVRQAIRHRDASMMAELLRALGEGWRSPER